jgi:hypothetical protein
VESGDAVGHGPSIDPDRWENVFGIGLRSSKDDFVSCTEAGAPDGA